MAEEWTDRDQDIADAKMYGDKAEAEVLMELKRLGIHNEPRPEQCPKCGGELESTPGMVGEEMLYCEPCGDILWTNHEQAIRIVY